MSWRILYRYAWVVLAMLLVVGVLCVFIPKFNSLHELQRIRAELEKDNSRIARQTQELVRKQQRFLSETAFVERTAHESGRIRTNETVFHFPDE